MRAQRQRVHTGGKGEGEKKEHRTCSEVHARTRVLAATHVWRTERDTHAAEERTRRRDEGERGDSPRGL